MKDDALPTGSPSNTEDVSGHLPFLARDPAYREQEARRRDALLLALSCVNCGQPWSDYEAMAEHVRKYLSGSEIVAP